MESLNNVLNLTKRKKYKIVFLLISMSRYAMMTTASKRTPRVHVTRVMCKFTGQQFYLTVMNLVHKSRLKTLR